MRKYFSGPRATNSGFDFLQQSLLLQIRLQILGSEDTSEITLSGVTLQKGKGRRWLS